MASGEEGRRCIELTAGAVICSVLSREGRAGTKRPRRGRFRRGLVLSVLCLQGRLNVTNARLM